MLMGCPHCLLCHLNRRARARQQHGCPALGTKGRLSVPQRAVRQPACRLAAGSAWRAAPVRLTICFACVPSLPTPKLPMRCIVAWHSLRPPNAIDASAHPAADGANPGPLAAQLRAAGVER
ncbi:hypothetical protein ABPG75_008226 [Micractinium tetrahymenae]